MPVGARPAPARRTAGQAAAVSGKTTERRLAAGQPASGSATIGPQGRNFMNRHPSRRAFAIGAVAALAAPVLVRGARGEEALRLRCSLDTAPSHGRNISIKDYLGKVEAASGGRIKAEVFESGQLFPDLQVSKALIQGQ